MSTANDPEDDGSTSGLSSPPESLPDNFSDVPEYGMSSPRARMNGRQKAPPLDQLEGVETNRSAEDSAVAAPSGRSSSRRSSPSSQRRRASSASIHEGPSLSKRLKGRIEKAANLVKPRRKSKKWDVDFVLTNPRSLLATADIRAMLLHPLAWERLSTGDQKELIAIFPPEHVLDAGTENARPNYATLANDNNFRYDCARYSENIKDGKHDKQWLREAWAAHERHVAGDFDAYLVEKFERDWEEELPDEYKPACMRADPVKDSKEKEDGSVRAAFVGVVDDRDEPDELAGRPEDYAAEREEVAADALPGITVAVKNLGMKGTESSG